MTLDDPGFTTSVPNVTQDHTSTLLMILPNDNKDSDFISERTEWNLLQNSDVLCETCADTVQML